MAEKLCALKKNGAGGANAFDLICSEKQISNASTQTKPAITFDKSISSGKYIYFKFRWGGSPDTYSTVVRKYTGSGNYSISSRYTDSDSGATTLSCSVSNTGMQVVSYSGSFRNIYVEIYDVSDMFS